VSRRLLFLDGHSLAFRAFFALPTTLETKSGQVTNAAYGFTSMLVKLLGDERPDGVAVCFDRSEPTFRDAKYAEYKAGRSAAPDLFREQLPLIKEVLQALRIPILDKPGFEADDLLATLTKRAREEGEEVVVVTGDRDCLQLVGEGVSVMMTRRGISDIARYDRDAVIERYGIPPEQWTDFAALKGETSDNLPGVPGVGDKTAAQLVQKYGSVDGVIEHADDLRPKIRDALLACAGQIRLNKELGYLLEDVELDVHPRDITLQRWDDEEVRKLFTSLEFPTIYQRLRELEPDVTAAEPHEEDVTVTTGEPFPDGEIAIAWDATWIAASNDPSKAVAAPRAEAASRLEGRAAVAHDAKSLGVEIENLTADTQVAAYVLEPGLPGGYALPDVVRRYLGYGLEEDAPKPARGKQAALDLEPPGPERAGKAAAATHALLPVLRERLENRGMWELVRTLEFPLVGVLQRMERAGVVIDVPYLEELGSDLGDKMRMLEKKVHEYAEEQFNIGSTPQLQRVLFEKLDLPKTKKIKTGWSTDAAELSKLIGVHPIVEALIEYREVSKLKQGFTDSLLPLVNPKTGRIHTTFLQTSAATGRLASTNPNIQNIPIRGELGRQIRRAFIAPPGHVLLSADYSQIELRVLAHLTGDGGLLDAFASGHDFHAAIAAKVYGIDPSAVTSSQRAFAKQFSFGIAYGMSAFGVSQRLHIEREQAQEFIDAYYAQFPKVQAYLDEQVKQARTDGFTTTMFGRRRYVPELNSLNRQIRAIGERQALNAPIQGSAADIIKRAMIDVDAALRDSPGAATMLLSVHDELVFEVPDGKQDEAREIVRTAMESAADLRCRLKVDIHFGANWSDAHA
jgi:DNA polymerase-1